MPDFNAVSGEEKRQALRELIELTDNHLTQQVLAIGMDSHEEDLVRIEAWLTDSRLVARVVLESLQSHPEFGASAKRELQSISVK